MPKRHSVTIKVGKRSFVMDVCAYRALPEFRNFIIGKDKGFIRVRINTVKLGMLSLPKVILGISRNKRKSVRYKNGNRLDLRKENLQIITVSERQLLRRKLVKKTSKFKGVIYIRAIGKWCASLRRIQLGLFNSELEAAKTYDAAAISKYGDLAMTNKRMGLY